MEMVEKFVVKLAGVIAVLALESLRYCGIGNTPTDTVEQLLEKLLTAYCCEDLIVLQ